MATSVGMAKSAKCDRYGPEIVEMETGLEPTKFHDKVWGPWPPEYRDAIFTFNAYPSGKTSDGSLVVNKMWVAAMSIESRPKGDSEELFVSARFFNSGENTILSFRVSISVVWSEG